MKNVPRYRVVRVAPVAATPHFVIRGPEITDEDGVQFGTEKLAQHYADLFNKITEPLFKDIDWLRSELKKARDDDDRERLRAKLAALKPRRAKDKKKGKKGARR